MQDRTIHPRAYVGIMVVLLALGGLSLAGCNRGNGDSPQGFPSLTIDDNDFDPDTAEAFYEDGFWGLRDSDGRVVVGPEFEDVRPFRCDVAALKRNGEWHLIQPTDDPLIEQTFAYFGRFTDDCVAVVGVDTGASVLYGYLDRYGDYLISPLLGQRPTPFRDGYGIVARGHKGGRYSKSYVDLEGHLVGEFHDAMPFSEGLAAVVPEHDDPWGFIDDSFDLVIAPRFEEVGRFTEGLAAAVENDRVGYINTQGQWVIPPTYEAAFSFRRGIGVVKVSEEWYVIDRAGQHLAGPMSEQEIFTGVSTARTERIGMITGSVDDWPIAEEHGSR